MAKMKCVAAATHWLDHWAFETPDVVFLAERRTPTEWKEITYADFRTEARRIAQGLIDRELSTERPVAILSGNDIAHAQLAMAAQYAGIPYIPLCPAYSLVSRDHAKLKALLKRIDPGLIFASDPEAYAHALDHAAPSEAEVVFSTRNLYSQPVALPVLQPQTVAKILFTSGSTGLPKGVINTHRMLTSNQATLASVLGRTHLSPPPVVCDWLPWHHTFGGNHNFNFVLANGGTLFIDEGKPSPEGIGQTIDNLADVSPTAIFNVPRGFALLLDYLRGDPTLCQRIFRRLELLYSAAASLPPAIRTGLQDLTQAATGRTILFAGGFGATETAPLSIFCSGPGIGDRFIGKPISGVDIKLAPVGPKLELRVRGPNVTPGYWREEKHLPLDEDGYFRTGDTVRYADPADPEKGLCFTGRLCDDFKLSTGTWVDAGTLREQVISACAPLIADCLIVGEDRDFVSALLFSGRNRSAASGIQRALT